MNLARRKYLLVGFSILELPLLAACDPIHKPKLKAVHASKGMSDMASQPTSQELSWMNDLEAKRSALGSAKWTISGKLFGDSLRINAFQLENTEFVDCAFVGCTMLGGVLKGVQFTNCVFVGNTWLEGAWEDVTFAGCTWHGKFNMGPVLGTGPIRFNGCQFVGSSAEEMGYGSPPDYFGAIGGTEGRVDYESCAFERTYINGGALLRMKSCKLSDCRLLAKTGSEILLEEVAGDGRIVVGAGAGEFGVVTVRKSKFSRSLNFEGARIGTAVFEHVSVDLILDRVKAGSITLFDVTFSSPAEKMPGYQYGLNLESAKIGTMTIVDCSIQGDAGLYLKGSEPPPAHIRAHDPPQIGDVYSTEVKHLTIRNTPVNEGQFQYMKVGTLTFERLRVSGADFSHSTIGNYVLRDVALSGKLEFDDATISNKVEEGVTGTPVVAPQLQSRR